MSTNAAKVYFLNFVRTATNAQLQRFVKSEAAPRNLVLLADCELIAREMEEA